MTQFGLVQLEIVEGEWEANLRAALTSLDALAAQGAEILVLPELWTSFQMERCHELARFSREALNMFQQWTRERGVFLVFSQLEQDGDHFYNTAYVLSPDGTIAGTYRKSHLFKFGGEMTWFKAGHTPPPILHAPFGLWSVAICFDLRFPIMFRRLAAQGVGCFIIPAQWPAARKDHWLTLLKARAIENQCVMVGVNRLGNKPTEKGLDSFEGASAIFDPWGKACRVMAAHEVTALVEVDMQGVTRIRTDFPCLELSHPDVDG